MHRGYTIPLSLEKIDSQEIDPASILSYFPNGLIIFDLETTGLSAFTDRIIEIGAIKIDSKGKLNSFHTLINPEIPIGEKTIKIHGISDHMVYSSPKMRQVLPKFLQFLENLPIMAHNAKYDVGFLFMALMRNQFETPPVEVYDSCKLAKLAYPSLPHHSLTFLTKHLKIDLHNKHRAYADAYATAKMLQLGFTKITLEAKLYRVKEDALIYSLDKLRRNDFQDMPSHIYPIIPKIANQEIIEIKYLGGHHRGVFRPIKVMGLIPVPYGYSLMALCLMSKTNKSFLVNKITDFRFLPMAQQQLLNSQIAQSPLDLSC